jgi:hypothetical protein
VCAECSLCPSLRFQGALLCFALFCAPQNTHPQANRERCLPSCLSACLPACSQDKARLFVMYELDNSIVGNKADLNTCTRYRIKDISRLTRRRSLSLLASLSVQTKQRNKNNGENTLDVCMVYCVLCVHCLLCVVYCVLCVVYCVLCVVQCVVHCFVCCVC